MIVRHWMQADPVVIAGDTLVSEAKRILSEGNLHALPVVDDGRLRGLVTRANLLRMGAFVLRTQNPDEFNYFVTRLKVSDIMVRNPATVLADDTMQQCLLKGQQLGVAQFPVLDGERVVGIISANEIFQLAAHCLGAWERRSGLTLAPVRLGPGVLGRIADVAEAAGAVLQALYPIGHHDGNAAAGHAECKVVVRLHTDDMAGVVCALEAAGMNLAIETDCSLDEVRALADVVYNNKDVGAAVASGSFRTRGMIVAPCTVKTLSAIANSFTYNLVVRAADVQLKEGRKLVLMVRETPLHKGHLDLMARAADAGLLPRAEVDHGPDPPEPGQGARPGRHRTRAVPALDRPRRRDEGGATNAGLNASTAAGTVVYAIGDIHGRFDLLQALMAEIEADAARRPARHRRLVCLGDYVSRGAESRRVVETLIAAPPPGFTRITLRGNHEDLWLRFLDGDLDAGRHWFDYDGLDTLADYGVAIADRSRREDATVAALRDAFDALLPSAHRSFLRSTEASHRCGDYFFAHAGVRPGVPLDRQTARDLMWIRSPFLDSTLDHGAVVVHGHSIAERPQLRPNRIGIDTGAYRSGILTCLVLDGRSRHFLHTG